jgi:hypothetical protein
VAPIAAVHRPAADEPEIRFVNQCGRLKTVAGALPADEAPGSLMELAVHQGDQLLEGGLIAAAPRSQPFRDVASPGVHGISPDAAL